MPLNEDAPRGLKGTVVRGAGFAGAGHFLAQALNLAAYLVIARFVTPDEYGVYVAGSLVTGIGLSLSSGGLQAAVIQRRERLDEALSTAVLSSLATGLALAAVALATAPLVTLFFDDPRTGAVAAALSGWAVLRCAGVVPNALMQRRFSFVRRLIVDPAGILAFGIVSVVATAQGMGAWGLVLGTYASATLQLVLSWGLARWRPQLRLASFRTWLEIARFSRHLFAAELLRRVSTELPAAVIGRYIGADALGQYRYGERFGTQPQAAVTNVAAYVLLPAFARIATDADRLRRAFLRALRWIAVVSVPIGFILLPLGEPLVVALLGSDWHDAGYVVMGFFAYTVGSAVVQIAIEAFKVVDRPDLLPRIRGLSAFVTTAAVAATVPFGIAGVAVGVSCATFVVAAYAMRRVRGVVGVPLSAMWREVWPPVVAATAMVAAVGPLDRLVLRAESHAPVPALGLLALGALAGAIVYLGALQLVAPSTGREIRGALRSAVRRLRRPQPPAAVAGTEGG